MIDRRNVDALEGAIRDYVRALIAADQGHIAVGETVAATQQGLRDALRAAFGIKEPADA
jgi:hypothetical protein